jgi:2-polyprenyl-6-methoxyphenol hydroxylase-like FAD-dependent oxidoreductase
MGTTVESIENKEECASVKLTDGSSDEYDLIVGADGAYSKVRKMLFPDQKVEFVGEAVWRYPFKGYYHKVQIYQKKWMKLPCN